MSRLFRLKHALQTSRELFGRSRCYRWMTLASIVLVVGMIVLPLMRLLPAIGTDPFIPLHYNMYFGVDRFGPWYNVFILPGLGMGLLILNVIFEGLYVQREHILATFFATSTLVAEVILFVSMVFIVLLNL